MELANLHFRKLPFAVEPAPQLPSEATMSWLENTEIKVGVDLNRGGAIVYLAGQDGINLINNFDLGRQVQLSYFSGPVPLRQRGKSPKSNGSTSVGTPFKLGMILAIGPRSWLMRTMARPCM